MKTKSVTMYQARIVYGSDLVNDEWTELTWPDNDECISGSDFDTVLEEARECFESEYQTGILVIAEVTTRYHVIV